MYGVDFSFGSILSLFKPIFALVGKLLIIVLIAILIYFAIFFIKYGRVKKLKEYKIKHKGYDFLRWKWVDWLNRKETAQEFKPYGFTIFCGRQGAGKTMSMVHYLWEKKQEYPNCKIVTNFGCSFADYRMESWRDFFEIRNGTDGVIFAIDEIHSEYSSDNWKDFPESLLSEISQQRKQRIKIVSTAQRFNRVAKPIREQCYSVIKCKTLFNRWTFCREYEPDDFLRYEDGTECRGEKWISKYSFIQSNEIRNSFDTYEKIERMKDRKFLERKDR